ncbi:hypothetical protein, partial [Staphylococcus aureus]
IDFGAKDFPRRYSVETRLDGAKKWTVLHAVKNGKNGRAYVLCTEAEGRHLCIRMRKSSRGAGYTVRDVDVKPLAFGKGPSDFFMNVAAEIGRAS